MLTLVKEAGPGQDPTANSYAAVADGDNYAAARLNSVAWTGAADDQKTIALVMATRTIDRMYQFNGFRSLPTQPLQWPRIECRDPDEGRSLFPGFTRLNAEFFPTDAVPQVIVDATCELALQLLTSDRTGDPQGTGIKSFRIEGAMDVVFDKADKLPVVPAMVQTMLTKVGQYVGSSTGWARLIRT